MKTKKYVIMRIPKEAHKAFIIKKERMQKMYSAITGKNQKIPLTRVIKVVSKEPTWLSDKELQEAFRKKKRKC